MRTILLTTLSILLASLMSWSAPAALAQDRDQDRNEDRSDSEMERLQEKFERRYPEIRRLKDRGVVGETFDGYLAFVKDDKGSADARELVAAENDDRRKLYDLIADKEDTSPKKVAERNARRNFKKAETGDWLRDEDGSWRQKK